MGKECSISVVVSIVDDEEEGTQISMFENE